MKYVCITLRLSFFAVVNLFFVFFIPLSTTLELVRNYGFPILCIETSA